MIRYISCEILHILDSKNIAYMNEYISHAKPHFYDIKINGMRTLFEWTFVSDSSNNISVKVLAWTADA